MVWQALKNETDMSHANFRRENENLSPTADVLHKTSNLIISRCCCADDGTEMDKNKNARAGHAKLLFLSLNMHICDVLVAVAVVVAKSPYLTIIPRNRAEYRLILSRRGRRPSWLKSGDISQD